MGVMNVCYSMFKPFLFDRLRASHRNYVAMTTGADVRDILELTGGENDGPITKKDLINSDKVRY